MNKVNLISELSLASFAKIKKTTLHVKEKLMNTNKVYKTTRRITNLSSKEIP